MEISTRTIQGHDFILLKNKAGISLELSSFGAGIREVLFHDVPMTLSPKSDEAYLRDDVFFFGKLIGPVAGRLDEGRFPGKDEFRFPVGENGITLHSETLDYAFDEFPYFVEETKDGARVVFRATIPPKKGYPASVEVRVEYFLFEDKASFTMEIYGAPSKEAPIHLTNHVYWNLAEDSLEDDLLWLDASEVVSYSPRLLPLKRVLVSGPLDFCSPKKIGPAAEIIEKESPSLGGIDHGFYVNKREYEVPTYVLSTPKYRLSIGTDAKAFQIYSFNFPKPGYEFSLPVSPKKRIALTSEPVLDSTELATDFLFSPTHPFITKTMFSLEEVL